ncbi:MAG: chemotaxis protein CheW [Burkholderiaceae bacterium]
MSQANRDVIDQGATRPNTLTRRSRLREFQTQLLERMQAVRTGGAPGTSLLGVLIGQTRWLLDLRQAGEIVSAGTITPVPLTHPWYLGLTSIRGNLVGVVDFARFQGEAPLAVDKDSRIVAFSPALAFNGGLLVSRVLGLRGIQDMQPADHADAAPEWSPRAFLDRDGNRWAELDLSKVMQDQRFLQIGL